MTARLIRRLWSSIVMLSMVLPATAGRAEFHNDTSKALLEKINALGRPVVGVWTQAQLHTMARIRDEALIDDYAYERLAELTDGIGGRPAGSLQAEAAARWMADAMRKAGASVRLEPELVSHWVRGREEASLVTWPGMATGAHQKIVLTALGNSGATPVDGLTARVVVVHDFDEFARMKGSLKGAIVLFDHGLDHDLVKAGRAAEAYDLGAIYRFAGPANAQQAGAAAVLVRSVGDATFRLPHTGATLFPAGIKPIPAAAVTEEDADLLARLAARGPVTLRLTLTPQTLPRTMGANVIADWRGSERPDEVVVLSGHLDSWDLGTGATDDGAGIAMVMEAMHLMQKLGIRPRRTIRVIGWMDEEMGAFGSIGYARDHAAELGKHAAVLEVDTGADRPYAIGAQGSAAFSDLLRPISRVLAAIGVGTVMAADDVGEDYAHISQRPDGTVVPGVTVLQPVDRYFGYHHTAADTLDKVDRDLLNRNAAAVAVLGYALADAPVAIP